MQEKRELEEAIKQIERKKTVIAQEARLAHENASKYREEQHQSSQMMMTSKMSVAAEMSTLKAASHSDYSNTRFHNAPFVHKH